jgi:hypothetical protein
MSTDTVLGAGHWQHDPRSAVVRTNCYLRSNPRSDASIQNGPSPRTRSLCAISTVPQDSFDIAISPIHSTRIVPYASAKLQLSLAFWLLVILGIVIGAYSHILWDSFTHPNRWGTQVVAPGLNQIINVVGRPMPIYKLLQHLSSVLGLAALALLAVSLVIRTKPAQPPSDLNARSGAKFLAMLLFVMIPLAFFLHLMRAGHTPSELVGMTIMMSGASLAAALMCYATYFHYATSGKFIER